MRKHLRPALSGNFILIYNRTLTFLNKWRYECLADPHTTQVQRWIEELAPTLQGITDLKLDVCHISGTRNSQLMSNIISPLASRLVRLKSLCIYGDIGLLVLQTFGTACLLLTRLHIQGVPLDTLTQLATLLPNLTTATATCTLPPFSLIGGLRAAYIKNFCQDMPRCSKLTAIRVLGGTMTAGMWGALPPGIVEIECYLYQEGGPLATMIPSVRTVIVKDGKKTSLESLTRVLKAASAPLKIKVSNVYVHGSSITIPGLRLLHNWLQDPDGLVVDGNIQDHFEAGVKSDDHRLNFLDQRWVEQDGVSLKLVWSQSWIAFFDVSDAPYPAFKNVSASNAKWFLGSVMHAFTALETLQLGGDVAELELSVLASCLRLGALLIYDNKSVTVSGVSDLCVLIPSLKWLRMYACKQVLERCNQGAIISTNVRAVHSNRVLDVEVIPVSVDEKVIDGDMVMTEAVWS